MYLALLILPLLSFASISLFGRFLGPRGTIIISGLSSVFSILLSFLIFYEVSLCRSPCLISLTAFFYSELFDAAWGLQFDTLTAIMCVVVNLISGLVIIYSFSYMIADPSFIRFISYLQLFTIAMLMLVTADNYIQLFVGWEGVGLASFLLISFWFTRLQASKAAIQAMLFNRVGDVGLALGIICLFCNYNTTNYDVLFSINDSYSSSSKILGFFQSGNDLACILLFIGAVGKSGQFGLHVWLPNAMNAPTPVSALLHAATMVTAGVFLLARSSPLLETAPNALTIIIIIGAITTLFAGTIGFVQNDFKSIIAYSTCSQLGYMITVCGLSNYDLAMLHLVNHSFFKALLFLTAGAVIHGFATTGEQDIRKLGGLQQILIFSYTCFLIGSLALVGTPYLSGFYSKDFIIELASANYYFSESFAFVLTSFSVFTTSFYSFRLLFLAFHNNFGTIHFVKKLKNQDFDSPFSSETDYSINSNTNSNSNPQESIKSTVSQKEITNLNNDLKPELNTIAFSGHKQALKNIHEPDFIMSFVLITLGLGSIFVGYFINPMFIGFGTDFWNNCLSMQSSNLLLLEADFYESFFIKYLALILTIIGGFCAYVQTTLFAYVKTINQFSDVLLSQLKIIVKIISFFNHKLLFNKLTNNLFAISSYSKALYLIKIFDKGLLELLPIFSLGLARSITQLSNQLKTTQSGLIFHYASLMIVSSLISFALLSSTSTSTFFETNFLVWNNSIDLLIPKLISLIFVIIALI